MVLKSSSILFSSNLKLQFDSLSLSSLSLPCFAPDRGRGRRPGGRRCLTAEPRKAPSPTGHRPAAAARSLPLSRIALGQLELARGHANPTSCSGTRCPGPLPCPCLGRFPFAAKLPRPLHSLSPLSCLPISLAAFLSRSRAAHGGYHCRSSLPPRRAPSSTSVSVGNRTPSAPCCLPAQPRPPTSAGFAGTLTSRR